MNKCMIVLAVLCAPTLAEAHDFKLWFDDGDKKAKKMKAPDELATDSPEIQIADAQGRTIRVTMQERDTRGIDRRDRNTGVHAARAGTIRSGVGIPFPLLTHKKWYSLNGFTARTVRDVLLPALDDTCLAGRIQGLHWSHDDLWLDGYMVYELVWKAHLDVSLNDGTTVTWDWADTRNHTLVWNQHELAIPVQASAADAVASFVGSAEAYCRAAP